MSRLCVFIVVMLVLGSHGRVWAEEPDRACSTGCCGSAGLPGQHGLPGPAGKDGRDGRDGNTGPLGPKGDIGIPGSLGAKGDMGIPGKIGMIGQTGDRGEPGLKGVAGDCTQMPKSAFSAKLSTARPPTGSPIKFDVILTNSGNHYNPSTGKFTCVHPGTYYFVLHSCVYQASVFAHLMKNGQVMQKYHGSWMSAWPGVALSGGAVLNLKSGDQVWIEVTDGYNGIFVRGDIDSSFSGFILSPE